MQELSLPVLPLSERSKLEQLPQHIFSAHQRLGSAGLGGAMVIFEVCEDRRSRPQDELVPSGSPERMVIQTLHSESRDAVMEALGRVQIREPDGAPRMRLFKLQLKPEVPLKSVFQQMERVPMTVFSITLGEGSPFTLFFLRTRFTIEELRKELGNGPVEEN